jgi:hypothetical protein
LLFINFLPVITYAGEFIKPGQAIKPGDSLAPGKAITGGTFIIPGEVYKPGETYKPGQKNPISGKPLLPGSPLVLGAFIIPNAPPAPPSSLYWQLKGIDTGAAMQGGRVLTGGKATTSGEAVNGGQGTKGGEALDGGKGAAGGEAANGGQGAKGGEALNGGKGGAEGEAVNGGEGTKSGEALNGGEGTTEGEGTGNGTTIDGGSGAKGGDTIRGGEGTGNGETMNGGEGTTEGAPLTGNQDSSQSGLERAVSTIKQYKKVLNTYPKKFGEMLDGVLSIAAGFKITDLNTATGNKNLYKIMGKDKLINNPSNPVSLWLNNRYKTYLESFNESKLILRGDGSGNRNLRSGSEVKAKKFNAFFDQNLSFKNVVGKAGKELSENWTGLKNPLKLSNWKTGLVNKEFFKLSKLAKGNGLSNVLISAGTRIAEFQKNPSQAFSKTDLAAGLTTDAMFGTGSAAISAGIGWAAAAGVGAAYGSVVPGVGTIVGAAAGIGISLLLETKRGKRFKKWVEKGVKKVFNGVKGRITGVFG